MSVLMVQRWRGLWRCARVRSSIARRGCTTKHAAHFRQGGRAQKLRAAGEKLGLKAFGEKGEKFDPERHDALVQNPNPDVTEAVVADVVELGYLLGERMLRPAKVAVFVPAE